MSKIIITLYLFLFEMKDKDLKPQWDKDKHDSFIRKGVGRCSSKYYIPEFDEWVNRVNLSKRLSELGLTPKEWFDNNFLYRNNYTGDLLYPKCRICGKPLIFFNPSRGYQEAFCGNECCHKWQKTSKSFRESHSKAAKDVWSRENSPYRTEDYLRKLSNGLRRKSSNKSVYTPKTRKELKNKKSIRNGRSVYSKISLDLFSTLENILVNDFRFDKSDILYGSNEPMINVSERVRHYTGVDRVYLKLDFYVKSLNRSIEFNGDYWHNNPTLFNDWINSSSSDEERVLREMDSYEDYFFDLSRAAAVMIEKNMKVPPLIIWEGKYRSDRNSVIDLCLKYLLSGDNYADRSNLIQSIKYNYEDGLSPEEIYVTNIGGFICDFK